MRLGIPLFAFLLSVISGAILSLLVVLTEAFPPLVALLLGGVFFVLFAHMPWVSFVGDISNHEKKSLIVSARIAGFIVGLLGAIVLLLELGF